MFLSQFYRNYLYEKKYISISVYFCNILFYEKRSELIEGSSQTDLKLAVEK